jgi:hypoxanthine phosphoribosyltransferase
MKVLFRADEIAERVKILGREISSYYHGGDLMVIGVLKGSFMFLSDLVRQIDIPVQVDFARLSSYMNTLEPQAAVKIITDIQDEIQGRDVLIVDDILDTGQSMLAFREHLAAKGAGSVKVCTLLNKTYRRVAPIQPDFSAFHIEDGFVVGYGLDYAEQYRTLPDIYVLDS